MLADNDQMEELSYAYMHALAAKVGFRCVRPIPDRDSIDVEVHSRGKLAQDSVLHGAMIQFQLKAVGKDEPIKLKDGRFSFSKLPVKNYDELRLRAAVPRLLAVLLMPKDKQYWVSHTPDWFQLKKCMYWYSLLGLPELSDPDKATTTVYIPAAQCLTPEKLLELVTRASKEEDLKNEI